MTAAECLNCNAPIKRVEIDATPSMTDIGNRYTSTNQPCGCVNAGLIFDFTEEAKRG